jgi:hypothetical protein
MARRSPPRKVTYFEPVPPRLARNTVIESTHRVFAASRWPTLVSLVQFPTLPAKAAGPTTSRRGSTAMRCSISATDVSIIGRAAFMSGWRYAGTGRPSRQTIPITRSTAGPALGSRCARVPQNGSSVASNTSPPAPRARGHQLGEQVDRHARAAKRRIPAHDLAYQPILGRRLGSSGLAGQGAGDAPVLKNNQRKSNVAYP